MKKIAIVALLSAFAAAPAVAENMYVGANFGSAKFDASGSPSTTAFALLGGYAVNENVALEVAYNSFGSSDTDVSGAPTTFGPLPAGSNMNIKSHAVGVSGVGSYPINEQFSLFGKLGFASTKTENTLSIPGSGSGSVNYSKTGLTYGFGAQFNINKQVGIRLDYDSFKMDLAGSIDQNVMSIGGIFKF